MNYSSRCMRICFYLFVAALIFGSPVIAQQTSQEKAGGQSSDSTEKLKADEKDMDIKSAGKARVSLNLKDSPLQDFLNLVSKQMDKKFVLQPEVREMKVTAFLPDVPAEEAVDAVLKANGLVSEQVSNNIIMIKKRSEPEEGASGEGKKKEEEKKKQIPPPLVTEVVQLNFADAEDMKETLEPLLSDRGTIQVVKQSGFTGWSFGSGRSSSGGGGSGGGGGGGSSRGGGSFTARSRRDESYSREVLSQTLVICDEKESLKEIQSIIEVIDEQPKQVLISARIIEANPRKLRDLGFDFATGSDGAETSNISTTTPWGGNLESRGNFLGSQTAPSAFETSGGANSSFPFNAGMNLMFKKVDGSEFEILIHALKERADANVLSSPKILTLDNQQATMLVGTRFPILNTQVSGTETTQITSSLDYYENIGIQLNVIPQVQKDEYINMIIHPMVSNQSGSVTARGTGGTALAEYPIIATREAETQVMIRDNQTIAIGGLIDETERESVTSVPFLGRIPVLGWLFRRTTTSMEKVDLIIFLSARIIRQPGGASEQALQNLGNFTESGVRKLLEEVKKLRADGQPEAALKLLNRLNLGRVEVSEEKVKEIKRLQEDLQEEVEDMKEDQQEKSEKEGKKEKQNSAAK